jgi:hypothetical protein
MKKEDFYRWFEGRKGTQQRILYGALITLTLMGLIACFFEWLVFFVILNIGFFSSSLMAAFVGMLISGGVLLGSWLRLPVHLGDTKYEVDVDGRLIEIAVAPTMTAVWTYAFGTIESDRNFAERLIAWLCLPQRLLCAAWYVWNRVGQVNSIHLEACADIVRMLFRKAERVEVETIIEKKPSLNIVRTLRDVSLFDGVIFLTRKGVALSLTGRLLDDLTEWKAQQTSAELSGDQQGFD